MSVPDVPTAYSLPKRATAAPSRRSCNGRLNAMQRYGTKLDQDKEVLTSSPTPDRHLSREARGAPRMRPAALSQAELHQDAHGAATGPGNRTGRPYALAQWPTHVLRTQLARSRAEVTRPTPSLCAAYREATVARTATSSDVTF